MVDWKRDVLPYSIYIHWPFCKKRCHYCDFIAFEKHEKFEAIYHKALLREIIFFSKNVSEPIKKGMPFCSSISRNNLSSKSINAIYLGGGSPSRYPLHLLEELVNRLKECFDLSCLKEFTIECNPGDITEEKLLRWKDIGINRLSIGVQVLDEVALKNLNREQKNSLVAYSVRLATNYFDNISVDLIIGLPGVLDYTWKKTLKTLAFWKINHISVYLLTVYDKTRLYFRQKMGDLELPDEDDVISLYQETVKILKEYGFNQYEISNFAKPGFNSLHNTGYWDLKPYKGFGLSAASFDGKNRFFNYKNLDKYLMNSGCNAVCQVDRLSEEQKKMEFLMLKLRQNRGIGLHDMLYLFRDFSRDEFLIKLKGLQSNGMLEIKDNRICLTLRGMFIENEIILSLLS